jgi:hypothetical protein
MPAPPIAVLASSIRLSEFGPLFSGLEWVWPCVGVVWFFPGFPLIILAFSST